jgi:hypothetical protein
MKNVSILFIISYLHEGLLVGMHTRQLFRYTSDTGLHIMVTSVDRHTAVVNRNPASYSECSRLSCAEDRISKLKCTVIGANLYVWGPLRVKDEWSEGREGQQIRKHILSILFPSGSNLYLVVSVPMSVMCSVHTVHAFVFLLPASYRRWRNAQFGPGYCTRFS